MLSKSILHGTVGGYSNHGCRCPECKAAQAEYSRAYVLAHKEKVAVYQKQHQLEHKEEKQVYDVQYRASHHEEKKIHDKEYGKAYYAEHREELAAKHLLKYEIHRATILERQRSRGMLHREEAAEYHRRWVSENPEKKIAHSAVSNAIRDGRLFRSEVCEGSGEYGHLGAIVAHHADYSKPLDVQWLCNRCHCRLHMDLRNEEMVS